MAIIQSLQKRSWLLTVVIGLALLAFIVTGLDTSLFSSKQSNVIAEIDGEEYTYDEYYTVFEALENQQKNSGQEVSFMQKEQLYTNAWRSFLTGKLFEKSYKNLGLSTYKSNLNIEGLSDEEIQDAIIGENIDPEIKYYFSNPQTGEFDKDMLINVLSNLSLYKEQNPEFYESWIQFEKTIHENTLRRKYVSLVANGTYTTTVEAEDYADTKNNLFDIQYVRLPYETIADSTITVSDEELSKYYNTIKNEKRFQQKAGVSIEYVTFDIQPTPEDVAAIQSAVSEKAEDFKNAKNDVLFLNLNSDIRFNPTYNKKGELAAAIDSFAFGGQIGDVTPVYFEDNSYRISKITDIRPCADSAKVRHILVDGENAYALADSLKSVIEAGGDFAALARQYSKDSVSAVNGGIIDWFKEGQMVRSFQDSSFFGQVGKLYIAPSQYGVHVIEILAQGPKSKRVQVQVFSKAVTYSQNTRSRVYQEAVKFISENRTQEQFESAVEKNDALVLKYANNTEENQRYIPGIEDSRQVIRWAHQNKDDKQGEVSDIFRCGDKFVVAVITGTEKEGPSNIEDVKEVVTEDLKLEKKKTMLLDGLKQIDCSSVQSVADAKSLPISKSENISFSTMSAPSIGIEPVLIATIASLEKNAISVPIAGERGVYVAQVTEKRVSEVSDVEKEKESQRQRSATTMTNNIYKILEDKADISDNRINFN